MHRLSSRLARAFIAVSLVALSLPLDAEGRSDRAIFRAGGARAAVVLLDRATVAPLPRFVVRPFAISGTTIRTLAWSDLPMNGLKILSLRIAPVMVC